MKLFAFAIAVSAQDRTNIISSVEDALVFNINGREYKAQHGFAYDWQEAVDYCEDRDMQLIEFDEPDLYDAVWDQIGRSNEDPHGDVTIKGGRSYWVGYKEKFSGKTGDVMIKPNSMDNYIPDIGLFETDWWPGEPNDNENIGKENCVRMRQYQGKTGTMNDAQCDNTWADAKKKNRNMSFICQTPKDQDPIYPESPLCPSEYFGNPYDGCYVQNQPWNSVDLPEITCSMQNKACLNVSCAADGITAKFRADLFHSNEFDDGKGFIEQLNAGTRKLYLGSNEILKDGPCNFTTDGIFVILENWSYSLCREKFPDISPALTTSKKCPGSDQNAIAYTLSVHSPGNEAENSPVIEFYVDTTIDATCSYCSNFVIDATGFWINQEDVQAVQDASGDLSPLFDCKLYSDDQRKNEVRSDFEINKSNTY